MQQNQVSPPPHPSIAPPQVARPHLRGTSMVHPLSVASAAGIHHVDQAVGIHEVVQEGVAATAAQVGT